MTPKDDPNGPEWGVPNLTVAALPQSNGGVPVKVRGNDREGVRERRAQWEEWAQSLPKKGTAEAGDTATSLREPGQPASSLLGSEDAIAAEEAFEVPGPVPGAREAPAEADDRRGAPGPSEYRMVLVPPAFNARRSDGGEGGEEVARWLQSLANRLAEEGWEFYRVDALAPADRAGRPAALSGGERAGGNRVATFRRPRHAQTGQSGA